MIHICTITTFILFFCCGTNFSLFQCFPFPKVSSAAGSAFFPNTPHSPSESRHHSTWTKLQCCNSNILWINIWSSESQPYSGKFGIHYWHFFPCKLLYFWTLVTYCTFTRFNGFIMYIEFIYSILFLSYSVMKYWVNLKQLILMSFW